MSERLTEIYKSYIKSFEGGKQSSIKGKGSRKDNYEKYMAAAQKEYGEDIDATLEKLSGISDAEEKKAFLREYGESFMDRVEEILKDPKKNKVKKIVKFDTMYFTIMYTIPLIMMADSEEKALLAEAVRFAWGKRFDCPDIQISTYEQIRDSFNTKILGLFSL